MAADKETAWGKCTRGRVEGGGVRVGGGGEHGRDVTRGRCQRARAGHSEAACAARSAERHGVITVWVGDGFVLWGCIYFEVCFC
jgi:hypothetical protein